MSRSFFAIAKIVVYLVGAITDRPYIRTTV